MTMPAENVGAAVPEVAPSDAPASAPETAPAETAPVLSVGDVVLHSYSTSRDGETSALGIVVAVEATETGQRAAICRLGAASGMIPAGELRRA